MLKSYVSSAAACVVLLSSASCAPPPAQLTSDGSKSTLMVAVKDAASEIWGDSGLLALEIQREDQNRDSEPADPREDLSPDDPADLPEKVACDDLASQIGKHEVSLNQEGTWHQLLQTDAFITFRALARAANAKHCRATFKDPGDKERDDVPPPQDSNAKLQARPLAYDCSVLTEKLSRAYAQLAALNELQQVRQMMTYQTLLADARLAQAAHCWP